MRIEKCVWERERDQAKSGALGSKIPTSKFYKELNFLKGIVTNPVTTNWSIIARKWY